MAAKRPRGDSDENSDRLGDKRIKRLPSFATFVILIPLFLDFISSYHDHLIRKRTGKRPLLVGDVTIMLRDGAALVSELYFTDNSSWGKSGMFKIGARELPRTKD
ncbi:hypothetical protein BHE74_00041091 [Ensete ventricosum]|nr:hypothetical protein BHE74_00041091 [Ensete ventricosum]